MKSYSKSYGSFLHILFVIVFSYSVCYSQNEGVILNDIPEKINTETNYLFYLHGQIIEELGVRPTHPKYGVYEYEQILDSLRQGNFIVISEAREKGTDPEQYAKKVAEQVKALLKAGVPAEDITVVGASKGAIISFLTSTLLKEKNVNFVMIAICNDWVLGNFDFNLYGNILSIYEESDVRNGSCKKEFFKRSEGINKFKEIKLNTGLEHGVLYRPIKEWLHPVIEWAKGSD